MFGVKNPTALFPELTVIKELDVVEDESYELDAEVVVVVDEPASLVLETDVSVESRVVVTMVLETVFSVAVLVLEVSDSRDVTAVSTTKLLVKVPVRILDK